MHRHGQAGHAGLAESGVHTAEGAVDARALGGERQRDDGVREVDARFGHANRFARAVGGGAEREQGVVGQADVFGGDDDEPARDVERGFARGEHAGEVVEGGGGVGAAN